MFDGVQGTGGDEQTVSLTLYTDSYVIRGTMRTRQHRVADALNEPEHDFVVLTDTVLDEYGSRAPAVRAAYAQVNLGAVLFAAGEARGEAVPEQGTPKVSEPAMISIPPFRIAGRIHLLRERHLRDPIGGLIGRFVPVTDAAFWSEAAGVARQTASMVAFNRARAQIVVPHGEADRSAGLGRSGEADTGGGAPDAIGDVPTEAASTSTVLGVQDPWPGGTQPSETPDRPAADPSRDTAAGGAGGAAGAPRDAGSGPGNPWGGAGGDPWGTRRTRRDDELIG